jgi:hypothetical protein
LGDDLRPGDELVVGRGEVDAVDDDGVVEIVELVDRLAVVATVWPLALFWVTSGCSTFVKRPLRYTTRPISTPATISLIRS